MSQRRRGERPNGREAPHPCLPEIAEGLVPVAVANHLEALGELRNGDHDHQAGQTKPGQFFGAIGTDRAFGDYGHGSRVAGRRQAPKLGDRVLPLQGWIPVVAIDGHGHDPQRVAY